jgi:hypothetical protein
VSSADTEIHPAGDGRDPAYPGVGFRLGEYVIKDTLGHGSMATVFLAEDGTGHDVAIKIFQEGPGVSPTMLERFRREAEATKKLRRHPNIMKVYATGKNGPWHYIIMEPIRNSRTLEDALEVTRATSSTATSNPRTSWWTNSTSRASPTSASPNSPTCPA